MLSSLKGKAENVTKNIIHRMRMWNVPGPCSQCGSTRPLHVIFTAIFHI